MIRSAIAILAGATLAATGCGGSTSTVVGTVTVRSAPLESGTVLIRDATGETRLGEIRDGQFRVSGVSRGEAKLAVVSAVTGPAVKDHSRRFGEFGRSRAKHEKAIAPIPKDYREPAQSPFRVNLDRSTVEVTLAVP